MNSYSSILRHLVISELFLSSLLNIIFIKNAQLYVSYIQTCSCNIFRITCTWDVAIFWAFTKILHILVFGHYSLWGNHNFHYNELFSEDGLQFNSFFGVICFDQMAALINIQKHLEFLFIKNKSFPFYNFNLSFLFSMNKSGHFQIDLFSVEELAIFFHW